jgi:hypothetical protein
MNNILPQHIQDATPQGALVRALESEYPHSLPATTGEVSAFLAMWVLARNGMRPALGVSEAIATMENWYMQRKATMS